MVPPERATTTLVARDDPGPGGAFLTQWKPPAPPSSVRRTPPLAAPT